MNIAIIYHKSDADGILSMLIARAAVLQRANAVVDTYGWTYGEKPLTPKPMGGWHDYDEVIVVDLTYAPVMDDDSLFEKVTWLDHHKTAIDQYDSEARVNTGRSFKGYRAVGSAAVRLCWQFFFPNRPEPQLVTLVHDHDVFEHKVPLSAEFDLGLSCGHRNSTLRDILRLSLQGEEEEAKRRITEIAQAGLTISTFLRRKNASLTSFLAHDLYWEGKRFLVFNSAFGGSQQAESAVLGQHDGVLIWKSNGSEALISLYQTPMKTTVDLSVVAKKYGGGGHPGACGFRMPLNKWVDILLTHKVPS